MTEFRPNRRKSEPPFYLCTEKYFPPNAMQISSAVKGHDIAHEQRRRRRAFWKQEFLYGLLVLALLIIAFGSLFIIAEWTTR